MERLGKCEEGGGGELYTLLYPLCTLFMYTDTTLTVYSMLPPPPLVDSPCEELFEDDEVRV